MIRPLLAAKKPKDWTMDQFLDHIDLYYPLVATPKIDGFRCQTSAHGVPAVGKQSIPLTRSLKEIPNHHIRDLMGELPPGLDGEIYAGSFRGTQSKVMSQMGKPVFTYWIFDCCIDRHAAQNPGPESLVYQQRLVELVQLKVPGFCRIVPSIVLHGRDDLLEYETACLEEGWEGVMLRRPDGLYKTGRSTLRDLILVALKRFEDAEGMVVGFTEKMHNGNEAQISRTGHLVRSSHQANMAGCGTLGAFIVEATINGKMVQFQLGTGLDDAMRKEVWDNQDRYRNRLVKFKYQAVGVKEKPRAPVFLGFREVIDL